MTPYRDRQRADHYNAKPKAKAKGKAKTASKTTTKK